MKLEVYQIINQEVPSNAIGNESKDYKLNASSTQMLTDGRTDGKTKTTCLSTKSEEHCKKIRKIYGKINGNQLPVPVPLF